jgi:hypothetical protein
VVAALFAPSTARAHLGHVVLSAERYLKLEASPEGARVVVSLTLGAGEARRVLAAADADGDGTLTQSEADAYMAQWGEGLETDLPIEVDAEPVEVAWGEAFLDPVGPIRSLPATVEMVARVPLPGGRHTVRFRDRMRREAFDRTDVVFRVRDGAELIASGPGEAPEGLTRELAFGPQLGASAAGEAFTCVVRLPEPEGAPTPWWAVLAVGVVVIVAVAAARALARRRRPAA